jgi:hypothetical protein
MGKVKSRYWGYPERPEVERMADKYILLYGYGEEKAKLLIEGLKQAMGFDIDVINAEGHEEETVEDIISNKFTGPFEKRDMKVLMFVDFTDEEIDKAMDQFPKVKGLKRPIFCTPTEKNKEWTFDDLMDDLMEEELYFKEKDLKKKHKKKE